jgi:hypothetical protein
VSDEFSRVFRDVAAHMAAVAESPYVAAIARAADLLHTTVSE